MPKINLPTYDALFNPLIAALKELGGSGTIEELEDKVAKIMALSDEQLEIVHAANKNGRSEFGYRLAWARTILKGFGLLENSARGIWALTPKGMQVEKIDEKEVVRFWREHHKTKPNTKKESEPDEIPDGDLSWRDELSQILQSLQPAAFERLVQRLLRESGFVQVEVTGRSGDGGIDGHGIMRLGGLMSFHVIFQAKKYKGSVSPSQIRDFRGAMVGRADKGLFITTGTFTKEAMREATRDGAPAIDLMDGEQLLEKLKELGLGVVTTHVQVEQVAVESNWFKSL